MTVRKRIRLLAATAILASGTMLATPASAAEQPFDSCSLGQWIAVGSAATDACVALGYDYSSVSNCSVNSSGEISYTSQCRYAE